MWKKVQHCQCEMYWSYLFLRLCYPATTSIHRNSESLLITLQLRKVCTTASNEIPLSQHKNQVRILLSDNYLFLSKYPIISFLTIVAICLFVCLFDCLLVWALTPRDPLPHYPVHCLRVSPPVVIHAQKYIPRPS